METFSKECVVVVLDVAETMRPHLLDAKEVLSALLTSKILFNKQDVVGIVLLGTEDTGGALARFFRAKSLHEHHAATSHPLQ